MRISTIFMLVITILLTVVIMQNTGEIKVTLLFTEVFIPKLIIFTAFAIVAFILGIMVGRPRKLKRVEDFDRHEDTDAPPKGSTLSDEDRDYIN